MQICSQIRWRAVPGVAFAPPAAHHRSRCLGTRGIASPIITKGPELFDNNKVGVACARWFEQEQIFRLWYNANSQEDAASGEVAPDLSAGDICLAESKDGLSWRKKGPVILRNRIDDAAWDRGGLALEGVSDINGKFWLPMHGVAKIKKGAPQKVTIGLAHSTDGLEWTKVHGPGEGGCILERGAGASDWDHDFIMSPSLVQGADGIWQLHYFGGRMSTRVVDGAEASRIFWQLGRALSSDGLHFKTRQLLEFTNPVQIPEEAWGRRGGMVLQNPYDGPQFLLFYTMIGSQIINAMGKWAIGLATSDDGLHWTRLGDKPIIEGTEGAWDQQGVGHPSAFMGPDGLLRCVYHAYVNKGLGLSIMTEPGNLAGWRQL